MKMIKYLKSENLKLKGTFTKKLVVIMPLTALIVPILSPMWYEANGFNWWYTIILPGFIAIISYLVNEKDSKRLKYRAIMSLPVNLKKIWIAKILITTLFIFISCLVLSLGILFGRSIFTTTNSFTITKIIMATLVIAITSVWQIPLCLFIAKKLGVFQTILINTIIGIVLNLATVNKSLWWICPYSYTSRLMCPILRILPNGTFAKANNPLLNSNVILPGIILSIAIFFILAFIVANWFEKQEAK